MKTQLSNGRADALPWWLGVLAIAAAAAVAQPAHAQEPQDAQEQPLGQLIMVRLASGRTLTAKVDPRTDATQLWLQSERDGAVLRRPVDWQRVVRAEVAGEELSGEQLRGIVETIRRETPVPETTAARATIRLTSDAIGDAAGVADDAWASPAAVAPPAPPRVRSLAIEALVANLDAERQVDGLIVRVYPLDDWGCIVPVRGTLAVTLAGWHSEATPRGQTQQTLGRWTRQLQQEDFGPLGARCELRFQGIHPERDVTIAPEGSIHARLSVPGQGTFEATQSTVRIRPYSAMRDKLQQATGSRVFWFERAVGP